MAKYRIVKESGPFGDYYLAQKRLGGLSGFVGLILSGTRWFTNSIHDSLEGAEHMVGLMRKREMKISESVEWEGD